MADQETNYSEWLTDNPPGDAFDINTLFPQESLFDGIDFDAAISIDQFQLPDPTPSASSVPDQQHEEAPYPEQGEVEFAYPDPITLNDTSAPWHPKPSDDPPTSQPGAGAVVQTINPTEVQLDYNETLVGDWQLPEQGGNGYGGDNLLGISHADLGSIDLTLNNEFPDWEAPFATQPTVTDPVDMSWLPQEPYMAPVDQYSAADMIVPTSMIGLGTQPSLQPRYLFDFDQGNLQLPGGTSQDISLVDQQKFPSFTATSQEPVPSSGADTSSEPMADLAQRIGWQFLAWQKIYPGVALPSQAVNSNHQHPSSKPTGQQLLPPPRKSIPADQRASRKVSVRSNALERGADPHDPSTLYERRPVLAPFGRLNQRGEHMFRYESNGVWDRDIKSYTAEHLREYVAKCPRDLTIWVQHCPSKVKERNKHADKCRYKNCPSSTRTILKGWFRVAFDEEAELTTDGTKDPFKVAGCLHLWCFEQCFDVAELYRQGKLKPDERSFMLEPRNPMALTRDCDLHIIEEAYEPWMEEHESDAPSGPRVHRETLSYKLNKYHLSKQTGCRQKVRDARNGRRGVKKSQDVHMGDLGLLRHLEMIEQGELSPGAVYQDPPRGTWPSSATAPVRRRQRMADVPAAPPAESSVELQQSLTFDIGDLEIDPNLWLAQPPSAVAVQTTSAVATEPSLHLPLLPSTVIDYDAQVENKPPPVAAAGDTIVCFGDAGMSSRNGNKKRCRQVDDDDDDEYEGDDFTAYKKLRE